MNENTKGINYWLNNMFRGLNFASKFKGEKVDGN